MPKLSNVPLPPITINKETIGKRIAILRKKLGLTQKELANKIGIARHMIADYECNRHRIYDEMIIRIAIALNITADELLGFKKDKYNEIEKVPIKITKRFNKLSKLPGQEQKFILKAIDSLLETAKNK